MADLGKWRGRRPSPKGVETVRGCECPACRRHGVAGLKANKLLGFCCRATHNLWVLQEENLWLEHQLATGTYADAYTLCVDNSIYNLMICELLNLIHRRAQASDPPKSMDGSSPNETVGG